MVHALFLFPKLVVFWNTIPMWNHGTLKQSTIWFNLWLGKQTITLSQLLEQAKEWILKSSTLPMIAPVHPTWQVPLWTAPEYSCYKINSDGAIFDKDNNVGLGVVIRNSEGLVMASLSQLIPLPPTVIEVKTLAANEIHFLTSHFSAFNLSYVCRHCNKIAHSFVNKK